MVARSALAVAAVRAVVVVVVAKVVVHDDNVVAAVAVTHSAQPYMGHSGLE